MMDQSRSSFPHVASRLFRPAFLRFFAWTTWTVTLLLLILALVIFYFSGTAIIDLLSNLSIALAFVTFGLFGLLVLLQRPTNPIGWFFALLGLFTGISSFCYAYPLYGTISGHLYPQLAGARFIEWLGDVFWTINLSSFLIFLPLLFPTGHLFSRRWRVLVWLTVLVILLDDTTGTVNFFIGTVHLFGMAIVVIQLNSLIQLLYFPLAIAALISLIVRFVRSRSIERQQMKWLLYGCAIVLLLCLGGTFLWKDPTNFTFAVALICLPISLGTAILRYRLYDIDRLISRTLIYLLLSALLVGIYLGLVLSLQFVLQPLTMSASSPFPVVISTLTIAALFQPLRRAIQRVIDRSFYRRKYNAEQVLTTFGSTLHEEVELHQLSSRLLYVITETMQPEAISLWTFQMLPEQQPPDEEH